MLVINRRDENISLQQLSIMLSSQVHFLSLINVTLMGGSDDLYNFTRVVRGHPYLRDVVLTNVRMDKSKLTLDGVVCTIFATVQNLETVHLENIKVSAATLATVSHTHSKVLRVFELPNNNLDDGSAAIVASAISNSKTITEVDLSHNQLSDKGCLAIASALEKNSSVTSICLDGNGKISPEQLRMISALTRRQVLAEAA
jgi:Leucine-rich repeat (LRR) protein